MSRYRAAALALLLIPGSVLTAGTKKLWDFAPTSRLERVDAEKGAPPNGQPLKVDPATLSRTLASVRFLAKAKEEPLFLPAEAEAVAYAMAEALALAQPGDDLELMSTMARGGGFFGGTRTVAARAFATDGKLNLIVRDPRLELIYIPNPSDYRMLKIDFGSRAKAGPAVIKAPGAEARRADWLVLPLEAAPPAAAQPAALPAAEPAPRPSASIEQHLRDLKRFRDQDLITEEDYAKQKAELLKALTSDVAK